MDGSSNEIFQSLAHLLKAHPWHGVAIGEQAPAVVSSYIEIVPTDTVKYEVDKATGHLRVDRPQKYSNQCPSLYGFIPQTYCGAKNGQFCSERTGRPGIVGDGDPLDICILSERSISHGDILVRAVPIGGMRMIDSNQADDKIVAVLFEDPAYGEWKTISDCPSALIERLRHYFLTYKDFPSPGTRKAEITHVYDVDEAYQVIEKSREDYRDKFGAVAAAFASLHAVC